MQEGDNTSQPLVFEMYPIADSEKIYDELSAD